MRIACCAIHFGAEYLAWAVRGVQDAVDEVHMFYAPEPSYGFRQQGAICPDSEEKLRFEASRFATKPIVWHRVTGTTTEGQHRDLMISESRRIGAQQYLVFDADEVWDPVSAKVTLDAIAEANSAGRWLAHFWNFWHSFEYMVHDGFKPVRVVDMRHHPFTRDEYLTEIQQPVPVLHFGYAQSLQTMRYKFTCHSHNEEGFRPGWFDNKFMGWKLGDSDCHPCARDIWTPSETPNEVKLKVKELMYDHPYFGLLDVVK